MKRIVAGLAVAGGGGHVLGVVRGGRADAPEAPAEKARLRRPVALVLSEDGKRLFVANQRSGSVSVIDAETLGLAGEIDVGRKLADLTAGPGGKLLAVDEEAHDLLVLSPRD